MISVFDKRPPFVRFEEREMGLDQVATAAAGRPIPRVVFMACITTAGSKDCFEKEAEQWLKEKHDQALNGTFPLDWVTLFKAQFEAFKQGHELPREGTPIKTWAMCSRMDANQVLAAGITTVEDLAAYPDSNLGSIGMNGRYLRDLARGWITEAKDKGANAKALADANVKIGMLEETLGRQNERIDRLTARLEQGDEPKGRGKRQDAAA